MGPSSTRIAPGRVPLRNRPLRRRERQVGRSVPIFAEQRVRASQSDKSRNITRVHEQRRLEKADCPSNLRRRALLEEKASLTIAAKAFELVLRQHFPQARRIRRKRFVEGWMSDGDRGHELITA